ncbi:MAG TPA: hypothetical protein VNE39_12355 [Planctomycetota bacterium]|nr:hypothetical protein [Planctomycetota bacterium]
MTEAVPYWARAAALVALLSAVAAVDLAKHGRKATRWREYGFVLAAGAVAGLFGLANDLVTSSISPEYFILGKGLPTESLRRSAAALGLRAGFSAGVVAAAICVYVATRRAGRPPFPMCSLCLLMWRPFALAAGFAALLPLLLSGFDPLGLGEGLGDLVGPHQVRRFLSVWWTHLGLYLGLLAGVVWIAVDVARKRRPERSAAEEQAQE